jgi:5-hydroxyisourate hydrolase-like protein (transthyretin family)
VRIRTRVLDQLHGCPADGVHVRVESLAADGWATTVRGVTGDDGCWDSRILPANEAMGARLVLDSGGYFAGLGIRAACLDIVVAVAHTGAAACAHVIVLLAPAGHSVHVRSDHHRCR